MNLKKLFERLGASSPTKRIDPASLPVESIAPDFRGIVSWENSAPLRIEDLRGKVVLVDFWTYSCVNCVRATPHVQAWHERYKDHGLVIVGVHTPEFPFEQDPDNVREALAKMNITYPVALDNDYVTWRAYNNHYWPAHYFVDAKGRIRYHHVGEGDYAHSEAVIRALLKEAGHNPDDTTVSDSIAEHHTGEITPETYLGYSRMQYLGSPEQVINDSVQRYSAPQKPADNIFYFVGDWEVRGDYAVPRSYGASIIYRVTAKHVHVVLDGKNTDTRLQLLVDGKDMPMELFGKDAVAEVKGTFVHATESRMYTLLETQKRDTFLVEMRFLEPGAKVFAITFG